LATERQTDRQTDIVIAKSPLPAMGAWADNDPLTIFLSKLFFTNEFATDCRCE